ncbi:MAG TPA: PspC domain-containing protein [Chryseolinea sp.]|nr:PspC domain-containing protein [Chryseolinea sp.]
MKKNISINISGIIFHIEEDGYENLRKYLDSINKYFASFEDSSEILADIESRVAEIFLSKLNEGKQVITSDDVTSLIATMGSVSDFKAAEEQEFTQTSGPGASSQGTSSSSDTSTGKEQKTFTSPRQLLRDERRKILGGVCSGMATYFNVDPIWIRLLFALTAFAYGITIIAYIVMWIVVPGSTDLDEPDTGKKMFRDPERKVIGGVSGGIAAYFGIDLLVVRLLFVIFTIFFGVGFIIYIVLWIALPEAKSLTDRMEMQGEPVTLSNIESNIKKNLNVDPNKEETPLTKLLLLPFRLIGILITVLGKILVPILEVLRVVIGITVILFGLALMFTAVITSGALVGLFSSTAFSWPWVHYDELSMPLEVFANSLSGWLILAAFIAAIVPTIFIMILGASIIARRFVINTTVGWSMFVLFFVSVAILSVSIPKIVYSFKETGIYKVEETYNLNGKTAVFQINEVGMDDYDPVSLTLKGYNGTGFKLVQSFESRGASKQQAIENAKMVVYNVVVKDSILTFDSNIRFKEDAIFRAQRLNMTLYIPYNYPFVLDESSSRFITQYIDYDDLEGNTWIMTDKGIKCQTCPEDEDEEEESYENDDENKLGLSDFDELDIRGLFDVHIMAGDEYAVELQGSDDEKRKYNIYRHGQTLVVEYDRENGDFDWNGDFRDVNEIRLNITMPNLERIEAEGYGSIKFDEFTSDNMEIELRGPVNLRGVITAHNLSIDLTGKAEAELSGAVNNLDADLEFASKLQAYNLEAEGATVDVSGASTAKVNVSHSLEMNEGLASDIDFRGDPQIIKRD